MLSDTYAQCRYAECHYTECRYAERRYAEPHYAERHYAECRYAERRYAERRSATYTSFLYLLVFRRFRRKDFFRQIFCFAKFFVSSKILTFLLQIILAKMSPTRRVC